MFKVRQIKLNYNDKVSGMVKMPQLSWIMESDDNNIKQTAHIINVAADKDFSNIIFDTGEVYTDKSAHIILDLPLKTAEKYFIRVKVKNNKDEWSNWSDTADFISGIVDNNWLGDFISAETAEDAVNSKGTYLRKEFALKGEIQSAYAYTTALGLYHFYINGEKVGNDEMTPGWTSYNKHLCYQSYDITDLLQNGGNVFGAHLGAGWFKGLMSFNHIRNIYGKNTAFLAQIYINYKDGRQDIIVTDRTWKGAASPVIFSEIYDGEIYDARLEQANWNNTGFTSENWHEINIIDYDKSILKPQYASKPAMNDKIKPKKIFVTPKGETVIDFGQNMTGWVEFKVKGKVGDKVELRCFEILDKDKNAYFDNLRGAKEKIVYICKGGKEEIFHPNFTFQGFQYVQIVEYPDEIKAENFTAYTVHSAMEQSGFFECSNPDINQLQHNILWGLKGNFLDVPTDCPQRDERLGWTGDAQIFCRTACYLMNTYAFYEKWLRDVEADQTDEGGVPHVVPDLLTDRSENDWLLSQGTHSATAWADVAVIMPWTMYLTYGDTEIIKKQYNSMQKWIDFMYNHLDKDGIWHYKLQFGDWVALDAKEGSYFGATPNELVCSAYYAYATLLFAKMAKVINKNDDYSIYYNRYLEAVQNYQRNFFDDDGNLTAQTQTAHILSLYFNLVKPENKAEIAANLVKLIEKENGHLVTGFVGTPYICHALSQNNYVKEAYELLLKDDFPSWLYQVKQGATTVWEHWDGLKPDGTMWSPDMNSFNHYAYGAIGEWLYRVVAGIEIDENQPGYKHIIFKPNFGGNLSYVKGNYKSVYGNVGIFWQAEETGEYIIRLDIPVNTSATLLLKENMKIISENICGYSENGMLKAEFGSGKYFIRLLKID